MATRLATASRNSMVDGLTALINSGGAGTIDIRTGSQPASANDAATGTLLATLTFSGTAFGASSGGTATANAITQDSSADATGTAGWARIKSGGGATIFDVAVTATGGGGELQLNTVSIISGGPVQITAFTLTQPAG